MKVEFQDKKMITSPNIDCAEGSFALDTSPLRFEECRERFATAWDCSTPGFFFKHPQNKSENVASFMLKTEMILKEPFFSKFSQTNRNTVVWVEPSAFWKACRMRRSLLTILLRAGMLYDLNNDDYESALFKQEYVVPTKRAVMRFLYGFTKYVGPSIKSDSSLETTGWATVFGAKDNSEIRQMLVSPMEVESCINEELLWAA